MGFNAFFFSRIDYQDYAIRTKTKEMEIVWRGSYSLGQETEIFTSVMYGMYIRMRREVSYWLGFCCVQALRVVLGTNRHLDGYGPPDGFCFECDDTPPIQDDRRLFNVNIKQRADLLVQEIKKRAQRCASI